MVIAIPPSPLSPTTSSVAPRILGMLAAATTSVSPPCSCDQSPGPVSATGWKYMS